jgi:hypothetical protein
MRDLAQQLLAYEANAGDGSEPVDSTTLRVYGKLRRSLGELAGTAGFQSLAFRALTLARTEVPSLNTLQIAADGNLEGITAIDSAISVEKDRGHHDGVILISHLLELLLIFLGEALTMNLLRDLWPDAALNNRNSENGRKREHTR